MIDPKKFLSSKESVTEEIKETVGKKLDGFFKCPEQGCYSYSEGAIFNEDTGVITWICKDGHNGKAKT